MRSYLDLVPAMTKAHRKQNRMTIFCIVLSVFLVTTIFGMADMYIRSQRMQAQRDFGNWHITVRNISDEQAASIAARSDVKAVSCYGILNYRGEDDYTLGGKSVAIMGSEESLLTKIMENAIAEGSFPVEDDEAMISLNAQKELGVSIGDDISVLFPDGSAHTLTVTGWINNTANLMSEDSYGVSMPTAGYRTLYPAAAGSAPVDYNSTFFVQFAGSMGIQDRIASLKAQLALADEQVSENTKLMALLGQSGNSLSMQIYLTAAVLFVLVLIAGILMIAGSLNSSVRGAYYSFALFVYGFLALIALVTVFNIVNSIAMSVGAHTKQYGVLRAIGLSNRQLSSMITVEAVTYSLTGSVIGTGVGLLLNYLLFFMIVSFNWGDAWRFPLTELTVILAVIALSVFAAVRNPIRNIKQTSIINAIGAQ